jgi:carboxymethylenebutenolidase
MPAIHDAWGFGARTITAALTLRRAAWRWSGRTASCLLAGPLLAAGMFMTGCAGHDSGTATLSAADRENLERTAETHQHDRPVATPAATTPPAVAVTTEKVRYATVNGAPVHGYLSQPTGAGSGLPGLIVIHEWWGLNDNVRDEARRLAAEGYVTLAVDLYGGQLATAPPAAMKLAQLLAASPAPAEDNLRQAFAYLRNTVGAPLVGTIGWCLGGRWSLRTALLLPDSVAATVIYYGSVQAEEADLARLQMPVLGVFAGKDRIVPLPTVRKFEATMKRLGRRLDVHVYEGADHAFANPSGTAYDASAADDAWRRTTAFLRANLVQR